MSYLTTWKLAKKSFEAATKKKKPSEKFLGIFNKSSGLESVLKKLDAAISKKKPKEVVKIREEYRKTMETYYDTMVKGMKSNAEDQNYQKEVGKLGTVLNDILTDSAVKNDALLKDPKTVMTVAEAVGADVIATLSKSKILSDANLAGWLKSPMTGNVSIDGKVQADPDSLACKTKALQLFGQLKTTFDGFKASLTKEMERGKALTAAEAFYDRVQELLEPLGEGIKYHIGMWTEAQKEAIRSITPDKEKAEADYEAWVALSPAWKCVMKLEPLWNTEAQFQNDFYQALKKR